VVGGHHRRAAHVAHLKADIFAGRVIPFGRSLMFGP